MGLYWENGNYYLGLGFRVFARGVLETIQKPQRNATRLGGFSANAALHPNP